MKTKGKLFLLSFHKDRSKIAVRGRRPKHHPEGREAGIAGLNGPLPSGAPQISRKNRVAEASGPGAPPCRHTEF